jgi:hypothetical protein
VSKDTLDLYTTKDITEVRNLLIKEQKNKSAMTGLPLTNACVDHLHDDEQLVRAVINSKENIALGRIEGLYARYVGYWYDGTYPEFLRLVADYIERGVDRRYRHNGWLAKVTTKFCALKESSKDAVLIELGSAVGKNATERKKNFSKALMTRKFSYNEIMNLIKKFR